MPHIKFNTEVTKAEYKNDCWHIESVSNTSSDIGDSHSVTSVIDTVIGDNGELVSITPKEDVTAEFTDSLVNAFEGTRWVSDCNSWYLDVDGVPVTWLWAPSRYRKELKKINFDDYNVKVA